MLYTVPSTSGFERKPYSSLVLKIHTEKSAKQEKLESVTDHFCVENGKMRVENPKKNLLCTVCMIFRHSMLE